MTTNNTTTCAPPPPPPWEDTLQHRGIRKCKNAKHLSSEHSGDKNIQMNTQQQQQQKTTDVVIQCHNETMLEVRHIKKSIDMLGVQLGALKLSGGNVPDQHGKFDIIGAHKRKSVCASCMRCSCVFFTVVILTIVMLFIFVGGSTSVRGDSINDNV